MPDLKTLQPLQTILMLCAGVPEGASDVEAFAAIRKAKDNA